MFKVHIVVGARPNFIKVGPLFHLLSATDWADVVLVHTGQHNAARMSGDIFEELRLPEPNIHLNAAGKTHAQLTADVLVKYEEVLLSEKPDLVIVVGDVNSTVAACLAAKKLNISVAHLEAGLRSFDREMPEEINRLITDSISDILWTPSSDADENLAREGVSEKRIRRVGNVMIDAYEFLRNSIDQNCIRTEIGLPNEPYAVLTLHRPSNVDNPVVLKEILDVVEGISSSLPVVFPIHPRTERELRKAGLNSWVESFVQMLEPQSYVPFLALVKNARVLLTDSGGIQEETSYLGVPCLTLRENTERPITVSMGTNQLCGPKNLKAKFDQVMVSGERMPSNIPLWDGHTARRIVEDLKRHFGVT